MGTVHYLPPRLRLVQPSVRAYLGSYRAQEILAVAKHIADAAIHLVDAGQIDSPDEAGFVLTQYDLEIALFHACCLTGAREQDRELTTLLLKRKQEQESGNASL
ncbi:hypothetical protein [Rhizobium tumorigenes]|uniref:hypothetical protein n=1 Tax=Rhizobium tumorigenes TaxID=2041385 RepID=UPI00241D385C|nr:hypothetical protein [Rhizobium tumorigenes]WFS01614.1 hypothetical protein PR016_02970 [Rhizobium tumorigenes]